MLLYVQFKKPAMNQGISSIRCCEVLFKHYTWAQKGPKNPQVISSARAFVLRGFSIKS